MLTKTRLIALAGLGIILGSCQGEAEEKSHSGEKNQPFSQTLQEADKTNKGSDENQIDMKKLSEAFGNFIGRNLKSPGLKFDLEGIIKGIREGAAGQPSPLSDKEYEEMMATVQERAFKEMSSANLKAANDFMSKNSKVAGIIEIVPNKLQYSIIKEGSGELVDAHSSPKIHYTGKYQDGTVFGTSEEMGGPITIPLDQTIPGFSKGIAGMKEGEKRRLYVHPDLGYGTTGQLPPNELLIFDIEVIKANTEDERSKDHENMDNGSLDQEDSDDLYDEDGDSDREQLNVQIQKEDSSSSKTSK